MVDFEAYFSVCLICFIFTVFIWRLSKQVRTDSHLPPSPFSLPIIGHLHLLVLAPSPHRAFHKLSIRYGPIFHLYLGSTPCVIVSSPEMAKEIFKTQDNVFLDKPYNTSVDRVSYGGNGFIFARYGSYWKFMKKIVMSQLLNTRTLDVLLPVRKDEINRLIKYVSQKANDGSSVELGLELMKMTNNGISRMLMGKRCSEEEDEAVGIRKTINEISELIIKFNFSDHIWFCKTLDLQGFGKQSMDIHRRFDALMERVLREHQEARKQKKDTGKVRDLLDILLDISEDETMEMKLTTDRIKAFILDIFVAGTDTSAITVEWALAELINHPNIMTKAVEEIDQVVGRSRLLQELDVPNLPYLQAIVKESLRLHPVAPLIQRLSTEDCTLSGYHIPANTSIFINVWEVGRDPTQWENPLEFMPERFENKQLDVRGQHFQLVPFGGGRRMCPGTSLALMVVHVILGSMIQGFDWKAGKDGKLDSVDMEEGHGVTLPRANPLICVPVARVHPIPLSV